MSQFNFKFYYGNQGSEVRELELLRFTGHENISQLFDFDLELKSTDTDLDEDGVINKPCWLEIYYGQGSEPVRVIHGLINEFEDVNYLPDYTLYRAKMVPRIWQLGLFDTNEVYLNETIEQTLTVMLQEAHFVAGQDFRFQLSRNYRTWPFRLQYNETHFDFLQRIIEREGIYYYFEHNNGREVMVFCDNNNQLSAIAQSDQAQTVRFQSNSGINVATGANTVNSIICKRQTLPKIITLRDFNDENPSLDIRGESEINSAGVGAINLYGLNITSPEEGQALAEIHANAFLCRQKSYIGQGDVATMSAGHTFALHNHPKNSFNELEYVIESIEHEGANPNHYVGLNTEDEAPVNYSNSFTALSTAVQFAPKRQTVAPEINGTLNAVVDAEAQSGYAELDPYGRYKIKLPFDSKHRDAGRASHWVRMMQPYGGVGSGMHFPLRAGTRVLLAFIGGDPDRPFISGTINDSGDQQSIVTADNQTSSMIKTASGNKIEIEDMEGTNRIKLQTGDNKTYMHLGAPNHAGDGWVVVTDGMERKFIRGGQNIVVATRSDLVTNPAGGPDLEANDHHGATGPTAAGVSDLDFTDHQQYRFRKRHSNGRKHVDFFIASQELDGQNLFYRSLGDVYVWEKGNEYRYNSPGDTQFKFGIDKIISVSQSDGELRADYTKSAIQFSDNQKANSNLIGAEVLYEEILSLRENLRGYQCFDVGPGEVRERFENAVPENQWKDLLDNKSMVTIGRHNTFNIQHGNIFDFGGYWSYHLGTSYTETHGKQDAEINRLAPHDLAEFGGPHWGSINGSEVWLAQLDPDPNGSNDHHVEKNYNDRYTYTLGDILEVQSGNFESKIFGNVKEYTEGTFTSEHKGTYKEEHDARTVETKGDHHTITHGANRDDYFGAYAAFFAGAKSDISVGASNEMFVGVTSAITVGAESTVNLGLVSNMTAAAQLILNIGFVSDVRAEGEAKVTAADIQNKIDSIDTCVNSIDEATSKISSNITQIENSAFFLSSRVMNIETCDALKMMD
tara:strand:- start:1091 stop:4144 length:3054 start_codon:yes stop_codon:yes gene_type:complete